MILAPACPLPSLTFHIHQISWPIIPSVCSRVYNSKDLVWGQHCTGSVPEEPPYICLHLQPWTGYHTQAGRLMQANTLLLLLTADTGYLPWVEECPWVMPLTRVKVVRWHASRLIPRAWPQPQTRRGRSRWQVPLQKYRQLLHFKSVYLRIVLNTQALYNCW